MREKAAVSTAALRRRVATHSEQLTQLNAPDGGLHFGQAPVGAEGLVEPAKSWRVAATEDGVVALAVILERPGGLVEAGVVGGEHATFAARGHGLVLAEGEGGHVAEAADRATAIRGAVGLGAIFDDLEAELASQRENGIHVAGPASEVNGHHGPGARSDGGAKSFSGNGLAVRDRHPQTQALRRPGRRSLPKR